MTLGELIMQRAVDLGGRRRLTYRELSARAKAHGYTLNESTINEYVLHPLDEPPRRRTMEALAIALDVTFPEVVQAVAESLVGDRSTLVEVAEEPHVRAFVTLTEGRTDAERARMVDVIRSVAAALDASHTRTQPEGLRPVPEHTPRQNRRSRNT